MGTGSYKDIRYNANGTTTTITGLADGNTVWLRMIDPTTDCGDKMNIIVGQDFTDIPLINVSAIDLTANTYCDPTKYDGQADASLAISGGDAANDYRYQWYLDPDIVTSIDNDAVLDKGVTGVEDEKYHLKVIDNITGCPSLFGTVNVPDGKVLPSITTVLNSVDYSCTAVSPAGSGIITASVTGGSNGYTFEWYFGTCGGAVLQSTTDFDNTLSNRRDGDHIVKVINNTTLCFDTQVIEIIDNVPTINTSITKDSDQTECNPPDGQATVTASSVFGGATTTGFTANYTYQWYEGESTISPIALVDNSSAQSATLTGVLAGWYTVVVTETTSGCASDPEKIQILDNQVQIERRIVS